MTRIFNYILLLVLVLTPSTITAQKIAPNAIPVPDPEEERRAFQLPEGFEVNLFAADPLLAKPIQMNWDAQGRLWVATSETYPQIEPGKVANDKVLILSDDNRDGVADKTTIFADGLLIPTGVLPGDGGAYVANSTELLHLSDTNGDGKADKKKIVLSGFGTEDTHHIIHTFRWSPRGTMFFAQSIYIHSHVETPHGVKRLNAGGFWEYDPRTQKLGVFAEGLVNPWGIAWDKQGNMFATDGAGNEGINFVFPGSVMVTAYEAERVVRGLNPGSPKHCGLEILESEHFPPEYQGSMITCDFRAHRVCRFVLSDDGSGFASKEMPEIIKTKHVAFRPVDVKMGPDGALYIADWYNPIIQHGEVDFRDPRRDKTHGRIWRVTCKGRPLVKMPDLAKATMDQAGYFNSPNLWSKEQSLLSLRDKFPKDGFFFGSGALGQAEQDPKALREIQRLAGNVSLSWLINNKDTEEQIWWRNRLTPAFAEQAVSNNDAKGALEYNGKALQHHDPRVRLLALTSATRLNEKPEMEAKLAQLAASVLDQPMDRFLDFALWKTMRKLSPAWLAALEKGENPFEKPAHLIYALNCVSADKAAPAIRAVIENKLVPEAEMQQFVELLYARGNVNDLAAEIDKTDWAKEKPAALVKRLELMQRVAARNPAAPQNASKLIPLVKHDDPTVRAAAYRLVGQWRGGDVFETLRDSVADAKTPLELRVAAANGLIHNPAATPLLRELAEKNETPAALRIEVALLLTPRDVNSGAGLVAKFLQDETAASAIAPHWPTLLGVKNASGELTKVLKDAKLPPEAARITLRAVKKLPGQDKLLAAISAAGGIKAGQRVWSDAEKQEILASLTSKGDAARGEAIYRRAELNCLKCHAIGGAGGNVGPELRSLGASSQPDYILESLLDPSKKIKEGYNAVMVVDDAGRTTQGLRVRTTDTELVLRNAEGIEVAIPKNKIDEQTDSPNSLMPLSLFDELTVQEVTDLTRFLSELGKDGPYAIGQRNLARRWQTPAPIAENFNLLNRQGVPVAVDPKSGVTWKSIYTTVAGTLPETEVTQVRYGGRKTGVGFLRTEIEVTTPGKLSLKLNDIKGLSLWIGSEGQVVRDNMIVDLPVGKHTILLTIEMAEREAPVELELLESPGSMAKAAWFTGP
jgi:putative heme-binding domain-containing protein